MKNDSITKGYCLRPETHRLIKQVKDNLRASHDKILSDALNLNYFELKKHIK